MKSFSGLVNVDEKHVEVRKGFCIARNIAFIDFGFSMAPGEGDLTSATYYVTNKSSPETS